MLKARHVGRLLRILAVLRRHRLLGELEGLQPGAPAAVVIKLFARRGTTDQPLGERLRLALQDLGPIFVKFGQALSTRPDLLPAEVARELAKLQDRVPPFPGDQARAALERAYGRPPEEVFAHFETEALASASIAQVHAARLSGGEEVVVKVLRPGISGKISKDLDVLKALARLAHRYFPDTRRLRPQDVVDEYAKTLEDELDLMREAANAAQLRRNFDHSELLYVPEVYFDFCRPRVLVIERVAGVPVSDIDTLNANGANLKVLADRGVEIFFTQVFRHNFFHADMHPGNIFVDISDPQLPSYIAIDFGIVGTLTPRDQHYLAGNLLAFFKRDYRRVAELHVESEWVPAGTRVDEFESAIRTVCEPIFNRPLKDISFGQFLVRLFGTARRFNMEVQPQLILLQKTLLNIEGLGRQLYPDLDLWQTAKPFLEDWMREQASGRELFNHVREHLPELSGSLQDAPQLAFRALQHLADGKLQFQAAAASRPEPAAPGVSRPLVLAVVGGGLLLAATVSLGLKAWPEWLAVSGGVAGLLALAGALSNKS